MKTVSVILGKVEEFELEERRVVSVCRKTGAFLMQIRLLMRMLFPATDINLVQAEITLC